MVFKFEPIYKERIWGGSKIKNFLQREIPLGNHVGESWEIVDREKDNSVIANSKFKGKTLAEMLESQGKNVMGPKWETGSRFPLLVKWLDCSERLSLQVHPPYGIAETFSGEPKTENWYVAEARMPGFLPGLREELPPTHSVRLFPKRKPKVFVTVFPPGKGTRFWWKAEGFTPLIRAT